MLSFLLVVLFVSKQTHARQHVLVDLLIVWFVSRLQIQLSFKTFVLAKPNDCESNFVDVFSDRTDIPSRDKNFCGSIADTVTSKNDVMFIRFFAEPRASKSTFEAIFTAFRDEKSSEFLHSHILLRVLFYLRSCIDLHRAHIEFPLT